MSLLTFQNECFMSFSEFLISEAIEPKETVYGIDTKNKMIGKMKQFKYTLFEREGIYYLVAINIETGEISFGSTKEPYNNSKQYLSKFNDERTTTKFALGVFNNIFYVLLEILKRENIKDIWFDSADKHLGVLYDKITSNKFFLDKLESIGYEYIGKIDNQYLFRKQQ